MIDTNSQRVVRQGTMNCHEVLWIFIQVNLCRDLNRIFHFENYLISSLNDYCKVVCKQKKTPENGDLSCFRIMKPHIRPN